uniref:Cyclin-dependent kinase 2 homolog n=1 Tax=Alexandrium catenella TaxID=2925 RepID=A0A7S1WBM2_ALECA|mmetsp:Transcript_4774/g.12828  ORF Transcript_4774/g.12828 Transcript_4774/m.12828 type:complete len:312 (+) Transcript_4774:125-1060(+)
MSTEADWGGNGRSLDDLYERLGDIGSGVFGTVQKARNRETNAIVAIKHLRLEGNDLCDGVPAQVIREVSLLRDFAHPNIAELLSIQINGMGDYNLILEYVDAELHAVLRNHRKAGTLMMMHQVAKYAQDLLSGIHACHVRMIIHRDLKPQNILIGENGLKICDFGLARVYTLPVKLYTHDVITLWYRAPEILLGVQKYGPEVDMWSAGCIITEMATSYPTFPGDSEIGTIFKILKLLGTPTEESWPGFSKLEYWKDTFPRWPPTGLEPIRTMQPELEGVGMDLITHLLDMNPQSRLSARRAKSHAFCIAPQ